MTNKTTHTCASCIHCSLDGIFCHFWCKPTELYCYCDAHTRMNATHAKIGDEVRKETAKNNKPISNHACS